MWIKKIRIPILVFVLVAYASKSGVVLADYANYSTCSDDSPCVIGEFLYDDEYVPITTATCQLTSKNPDGTAYLTSESMPGESDGWYSLEVTTTDKPTGLYRSQMCCTTTDAELLCLDKSFIIATPSASLSAAEVTTAVWDTPRADHNTAGTFGENLQNPSSLSASDIWSYPERSLTNFGSLVADIWSYSSRTLSGFGSLVANIWSSSARTLTGASLNSGSLATKSDVTAVETKVDDAKTAISTAQTTINEASDDIETVTNNVTANTKEVDAVSTQLSNLSNQVAETNTLLEKIVNKPVVETILEEGEEEPVTLSSKLEKTKRIARQLSINTLDLKEHLASLDTNWQHDTPTQTIASIDAFSQVLGASTDETQTNDNIATQVEWLTKSWDSELIGRIKDRVDSTTTISFSTARELKTYGKTPTSQQYLSLANTDLSRLQKLIGKEGDSPQAATLFGYIEEIETKAQRLTKLSEEIDDLLANLDDYRSSDLDRYIAAFETQLLAENQIPSLATLVETPSTSSSRSLAKEENSLLALKAVADANLLLLAQAKDKPIKTIYIENGSMIFKSVVSNPSKSLTQTVPIRYYLPRELKETHVLEIDPLLTLEYDEQEESLYVSGEVELAPLESKTFSIKTADVWELDPEKIASLRKQADILFAPLEKTAFFAQGATLKAEIEVNLDKAELLLKENHTPEARIEAYREAEVELKAAEAKLENLKTLVTSAGSVGTVFGFVGGVQTVAVWGLIIILITGFVFLALYFRMITQPRVRKTKADEPSSPESKDEQSKDVSAKETVVAKTHSHKESADQPAQKLPSFQLSYKILLGLVAGLSVAVVGLLILLLRPWPEQEVQLISPTGTSTTMKPVEDAFAAQQVEGSEQINATAITEETGENTATVLGATDQQTLQEQLAANEVLVSDVVPASQGTPVSIAIPSYAKIVRLRKEPNLEAETIYLLWTRKDALKVDEEEEWVKVQLPNPDDEFKPLVGWVSKEFVTEKSP